MKSFKQILNEKLSDEEYMKRADINDPIWREIRGIFDGPMSKEVQVLHSIGEHGYSGKKMKDCARDLTKYCKDIIELAKKLQEVNV